jgi:hypothetical protein
MGSFIFVRHDEGQGSDALANHAMREREPIGTLIP